MLFLININFIIMVILFYMLLISKGKINKVDIKIVVFVGYCI